MMTSGNYESNQEIDLTTLDRNKSARKNRIVTTAAALGRLKVFALSCVAAAGCAAPNRAPEKSSLLLNPDAAEMNRHAPQLFKVRLETSQGIILLTGMDFHS